MEKTEIKYDITAGNEIIADFCGLEKIFLAENHIGWKLTSEENPVMLGRSHVSFLQFHESWDWLMPVVKKINTLGIDDFGEPELVIFYNQALVYDCDRIEHFINYSPSKTGDDLILAVWMTVIDFIKFYIINFYKSKL